MVYLKKVCLYIKNNQNYNYMSSLFGKKDINGYYTLELKDNKNIKNFSWYFFIKKVSEAAPSPGN